MVIEASAPITLFYCYAREDQALRDELDIHLEGLRRSRLITCWYDGELLPGVPWEQEIELHLDVADVILLLVSPAFIKSDYCYGKEMQRAIERHQVKKVRIIPILLRPVDWTDAPFAHLQMLPANATPITSWPNRDEAFVDVAKGIRRVVSDLHAQWVVQQPRRNVPAKPAQPLQRNVGVSPIQLQPRRNVPLKPARPLLRSAEKPQDEQVVAPQLNGNRLSNENERNRTSGTTSATELPEQGFRDLNQQKPSHARERSYVVRSEMLRGSSLAREMRERRYTVENVERRPLASMLPSVSVGVESWLGIILIFLALFAFFGFTLKAVLLSPGLVFDAPWVDTAAAPKTVAIVSSPCLASSVLSQITNTSAPLSAANIAAIQHDYKQAPAMSINTAKIYCAGINTSRGLIVVELDPKLAPKTVNNFVFLAQRRFYDGLVFYPVYKKFIQSGNPLWNSPGLHLRGSGDPGYHFADEPVHGDYTAGTIAMASFGPNTNGSQFFINLTTNSFPKPYNLFGHVVKGMDVANKIQGPTGPDDPHYQERKNIKPDEINSLVAVAAP